jgi:hypothetical protein
MPGKGKYFERDYSAKEYEAFEKSGLSIETIHKHFGEKTIDVYLNESTYWSNVPSKVWECYIGGYQVIKKWLSYREESIINRPLNKDEVREVGNVVKRIAAIMLLSENLNNNYSFIKNNTYHFQ